MLLGHVGEDAVLLARQGDEFFAIGATCSHYSGPLAEGLMAGDTVRCPWHHARFSLRTGEAIGAPAFNALPCWRVEKSDDKVFVRERPPRPIGASRPKRAPATASRSASSSWAAARRDLLPPRCCGAKDLAAVSRSYPLTMSRPTTGRIAPRITWPEARRKTGCRSSRLSSTRNIQSTFSSAARSPRSTPGRGKWRWRTGGRSHLTSCCLRPAPSRSVCKFPGADQPHVHVLRSLSDARAIIANATAARHAVVIGASFIGLEVAAALRTRNLDVHVVAPERRPLERILGPEFGDFIRELHEEHGVVFHLEDTVTSIEGTNAKLKSGATLPADVVVVGVGVRPRLQLAERAGVKIDRGVAVNEYLETSIPDIYAAGDIARWPDPHTGENLRIEHWVVAERQGQAVARNMLGQEQRFSEVPFFWSQHYDVPINYVGHAEKWDSVDIDGNIKSRDCLVRYRQNGKVLAVASIFRDIDSLKAEMSMEAR